MNNILIVIINGIIEGLTEFIPVSSTGHLILLEHWLTLPLEAAETFQISIQIGAIAAVLVYYRDFFKSFLGNLKNNLHLITVFLAAIVPVFIVGFLAYDFIKSSLFSPEIVVAALIVGGIAMIVCDNIYVHKNHKQHASSDFDAFNAMSVKQGFIIGLFQIFSLWPGMSRSGSTIVGGVLAGLSYKTAADFSFCLALPVIGTAVIYDIIKSSSLLNTADIQYIGIGMLVSFVVGLLAISTVIKWISSWHLSPFGIYRIILAFGVLYLL
ncbi:undecaprenyl-diphosphate phosphatase [bacterium]|nr:undecaprenyl-diphosphate phosphatase [bacterium]